MTLIFMKFKKIITTTPLLRGVGVCYKKQIIFLNMGFRNIDTHINSNKTNTNQSFKN